MATEGKKYTFYRKTAMGLSTWSIWFERDIIYYGHCMVNGGAESVCEEKVTLNQSGRNLQAQIDLQMESRLSRMLDRGYKATPEEALAGATNQLGLLNPMLALPINKVNVPSFQYAHVQPKFNGHRCLITRDGGQLIAYSRKGKVISTIEHITNALETPLAEGVTVDGELYLHGRSLQQISSLIKRRQPDTQHLCYHMYDVAENMPYTDRYVYMQRTFQPHLTDKVSICPTHRVHNMEQVMALFGQFRREGYEGAMLRLDLCGYEDNKRVMQLLKIKGRLDEDFKVLDVKPGKYDIGILVLALNDRPGTFDCTAPGSVPQKQEILANKQNYIGRMVTVLFAEKTDEGVPFHGVADQFVEEL